MADDDWFRKPCLTAAEKAAFEERLARSRSSRAQYMKIQAMALADAGAHEDAIGLNNRWLQEYEGDWDTPIVLKEISRSHRALGHSGEPIDYARQAIKQMAKGDSANGRAHFEFASNVLAMGRRDLYAEADRYLVQFWDDDPLFPADEFEQNGLRAFLQAAMGKPTEARAMAERAVAAAETERSGSASHPNLGLVGERQQRMLADLRKFLSPDE